MSVQIEIDNLQDSIVSIKNTIREYEFVQIDRRFNRTVYTRIGHRLRFAPGPILDSLRSATPLPKYRADWDRMKPYFIKVVGELKSDQDSRQTVVLNTDNYNDVHQCFLSIQFLKDKDGQFNAIVYQRSGDVAKLKDDLIFFCYLMKKFELETGYTTKELAIVYGSIHYTKE